MPRELLKHKFKHRWPSSSSRELLRCSTSSKLWCISISSRWLQPLNSQKMNHSQSRDLCKLKVSLPRLKKMAFQSKSRTRSSNQRKIQRLRAKRRKNLPEIQALREVERILKPEVAEVELVAELEQQQVPKSLSHHLPHRELERRSKILRKT